VQLATIHHAQMLAQTTEQPRIERLYRAMTARSDFLKDSPDWEMPYISGFQADFQGNHQFSGLFPAQ
jgi:hypothetical protein